MKTILPATSYNFNPLGNNIDFSPMGGAFDPRLLLAVIDVTTGALVYSTSGDSQGYGGTFSTTVFTNDTLTYDSSSAGQSSTDILQVIYEDPAVSSNVNISEIAGNALSSVSLPVSLDEVRGVVVSLGQKPMADSIPVTLASDQSVVPTTVNQWGGIATSLGAKNSANSVPVVLATDQAAIPVSTPNNPITIQNQSSDVFGTDVTGVRNAQIEITWTTASPSGTLVTTSGGASATASNGHTIFSSGTAASNANATAFTTAQVRYRPGYEMYCMFTAAWIDCDSSFILEARCGLYDTSNGFSIGFQSTNFGIQKVTNGTTIFIPRTLFNGDLLNGTTGSKFTRNGTPEAIDFTKSNLFRIRFGWLGSANIFYEVFSPDGKWVTFHQIKQPNLEYDPSIASPNLSMRLNLLKQSVVNTTNASIATACWSAGTTSDLIPLDEQITDRTLAKMTRTLIEGRSSSGGGSFIPVKVTPSGSLVTDSTVSLPDLYVTGGNSSWTTGTNMLLTSSTPPATAATDVTGYKSGSVQVVTAAGVTGNWIFEGSNDNVNFQVFPVFNQALANPPPIVTAISAVASSSIIYVFPIRFRYIRLRAGANTTNNVQCHQRYSQDPFVAPIQTVVQGTAANLNCTATVSGSLTTVSTVTTVSAVTSAFLGTSETADASSVNIAATGSTGAVTISNSSSFSFIPTLVYTSGTGTVDVFIEESLNSGSTWTTLYAFDRVSTAGTVVMPSPPPIKVSGNRIRYAWTTTGTVVGTLSVTRVARGNDASLFRRAYDRVLNPTNTTTPSGSIYSEGCEYAEIVVSMNAGGTAPVIQAQGSEDGTDWYNIGNTFTPAVGAVTAQNITEGTLPKLFRASVATAGAGSSLKYVVLKCKGA